MIFLVVSENGYGKRSSLEDYRVTNSGGKGVKTINITEKTGKLVAIKEVLDTDDLMIINKSGIIIRMEVAKLRVMGRATQGVRLIKMKDDDSIAAVTPVEEDKMNGNGNGNPDIDDENDLNIDADADNFPDFEKKTGDNGGDTNE